jgi:hypothetical protein
MDGFLEWIFPDYRLPIDSSAPVEILEAVTVVDGKPYLAASRVGAS